MDGLLAALAAQKLDDADDASRLRFQDTLRAAAQETETQHDTIMRLWDNQLQLAMVRVGCDLGLFSLLSEKESPVSLYEIATTTGKDPVMLTRILRYLASHGVVKETSAGHFTASKVTRNLADPRVHSTMYYIFDIGGPVYQKLPSYMKDNDCRNTTGQTKAWNQAFDTKLGFFSWAQQHQDSLRAFQQFMSVPRKGSWLDVVPLMDEARSALSRDPDRVILVDVGGSLGHQCAVVVKQHPELRGHVIFQDLEETIRQAPEIDGVRAMVQDFFTPQEVTCARYYYLRSIMHDWDDDHAIAILENLAAAMVPDSQILIDDKVLPDEGTHWQAACVDINMYLMLGAMERTADQWRSLLDRAGLKIVDIRTYVASIHNSIIIAAKK